MSEQTTAYRGTEGLHCPSLHSHQLEHFLMCFLFQPPPLFFSFFLNCLSFSDEFPLFFSLVQHLLWVPTHVTTTQLCPRTHTYFPCSASKGAEEPGSMLFGMQWVGICQSLTHTHTQYLLLHFIRNSLLIQCPIRRGGENHC